MAASAGEKHITNNKYIIFLELGLDKLKNQSGDTDNRFKKDKNN